MFMLQLPGLVPVTVITVFVLAHTMGEGLYELLCSGTAGDAYQLCCLLSLGVAIIV